MISHNFLKKHRSTIFVKLNCFYWRDISRDMSQDHLSHLKFQRWNAPVSPKSNFFQPKKVPPWIDWTLNSNAFPRLMKYGVTFGWPSVYKRQHQNLSLVSNSAWNIIFVTLSKFHKNYFSALHMKLVLKIKSHRVNNYSIWNLF